jgi:tRNA (Thr-GGU) A37 N-methylase
MPLQTIAAEGVQGSVELEPEFREGLKDLEAYTHLSLLTHLHRMSGFALEVTP